MVVYRAHPQRAKFQPVPLLVARWGRVAAPLRPTSPTCKREARFGYLCSGKEVLFMLPQEKSALVNSAKGIAKWFKVELKISVLGHTIIHWVYPPQAHED